MIPATGHIHMLGIAGAAMAPVAGMLRERGFRVTGSDTGVYPPASTLLDSLGIRWNEGYSEENLKPAPDLAVIGNALSRGNSEVEYILDEKIPYCSMPQFLENYFLPGHDSIVVAGTHGKTTTTAMLAWIFHVAGRCPDFLIGGVAPNFGDRSYGLGGGQEFIIEGDEYDTAFFDEGPKFLHYHPTELILTSLEFDHADIYPDLAAIALQFRRLVNLVPRRGRILIWGESPALREAVSKALCPVEAFGFTPECDWCAGDISWDGAATEFRAAYRGREVARIRTPVAGRHNVLDALAAIALAHGRGVESEAIERALAEFQGVRRRMEIKGEPGGVLVVEDFAHHPTAIRLTLEAARTRWPGRKIWAAVEPRSNTMRRKIFEHDLPEALSLADAVLFGPVNRAQLLDESDRLSPESICRLIRSCVPISASNSGVGGTGHGAVIDTGSSIAAQPPVRFAEAFNSVADLAAHLLAHTHPGDVILIMSNGSFGGLTASLLAQLSSRPGVRA
jgi:UDP-N-acetylmuramate: L-alanyl-gamma-D-glutamyl-meso-diaminopimelate ligase